MKRREIAYFDKYFQRSPQYLQQRVVHIFEKGYIDQTHLQQNQFFILHHRFSTHEASYERNSIFHDHCRYEFSHCLGY
jgi:hypothetical protein